MSAPPARRAWRGLVASVTSPGRQVPATARDRSYVAVASVALVAIPFTALLVLVQSGWSPLRRVDAATSAALHHYAVSHPAFVTAMRVLSTIGATWSWAVILTVVVGWLMWRHSPRLAVFVAVTAVTSSILNNVVKVAVARARPVSVDPVAVATGFSFPSGHAQSAVVGCGLLVVVFAPVAGLVARRIVVTVAVVMVLGIGFSRIALGVHYLTDVLAGYVLGLAWLAAMLAVFNVMPPDYGRSPSGGDRGAAGPTRGAPDA